MPSLRMETADAAAGNSFQPEPEENPWNTIHDRFFATTTHVVE
jgi:hypothetical protein